MFERDEKMLSEMRKYVRICLASGIVQTVMVTNRNNVPLWKHLRLLTLNDPEYRYLGITMEVEW